MTIGAGPYGYADWQRLANFDSPALLEVSGTEAHGSHEYGPFNVSRFLAVQAVLSPGPLSALNGDLILQWYPGELALGLLSERTFWMAGNAGALPLLVPNLGPWLRIATNLNPPKPRLYVAGSNRQAKTLTTPAVAMPLRPSTAFAGKETLTFYPEGYADGPATLAAFQNTGAAAKWVLETLVSPEAWTESQYGFWTSGALERTNIVLPAGAWRISVEGGAAGSVSFRVTPSPTGAT